ncbi:MAG TPA: CHRD domain-containing protein [Candidatus Binatia bacterium]|nr:CHRD domain-containing protein [Candidatus Binatia bacterium]
MKSRKRLFFVALLAAIILALPALALANKQIFKARLSSAAELHEVVGASASGAAIFGVRPDGMTFMLNVRGLSGPATGAHIHAPASTSENAPVVISLCGNPAPAAVATCTTDADGNLQIQGDINSSLLAQWGVTAAQLLSWFNSDSAYVNVHTALNPAGEARGQIVPQ